MTPADFAPYYSEKLFILPVPFYVTSYKADAERQNHLIQDEKPNSKLSSKDYKTVAPVKYPTVAGMCKQYTFFFLPPPLLPPLFPPTRTPCRARRGQRRHAPPPQPVAAQHGDGQFQSGHCTLCFFDVLHANECRYHWASLSHGSSSCTRPERCFGHLSGEF
jgi:hypothetical protein